VTIRRLDDSDWQLLRDTRLASLAESPEAFGSTYAREAEFDESTWRDRAVSSGWFLARDGETTQSGQSVQGIAAGYHDDSSPPEQRHLVAMWVAPEARGTGIAPELVEAVVQWAREDGATEVTLGVADGNERARALYLKCGFVSTGERFPLHSDTSREMEIYARQLVVPPDTLVEHGSKAS
jgi:RimJ/RimL family protein N-acetyltransferase